MMWNYRCHFHFAFVTREILRQYEGYAFGIVSFRGSFGLNSLGCVKVERFCYFVNTY